MDLGMGTMHMVAVVPCCKKALVSTAQMAGRLVYMADVMACCIIVVVLAMHPHALMFLLM